ncbi:MAG: hypothetical protein NTW28_23850, partial [Candidatus Solibacter sp.]|nr:hypothetical protein [Candidatus Solibacter sp.]
IPPHAVPIWEFEIHLWDQFSGRHVVLGEELSALSAAKQDYALKENADIIFSVILDQDRRYFYFFFGNYSGPPEHQGVAMARMPFEVRANPVGFVSKYYAGAWTEPGIGGLVSPIFPVSVSWEHSNTDALWGPAIHWNTHLNQYVVVLNRACCKSGWPQEGVYLSINPKLDDPGLWTPPTMILDAANLGSSSAFYPQVLGIEPGGTDTLAGKFARLFVKGLSQWEIEFLGANEPGGQPGPPEAPPDRPITELISIPKIPVIGLRLQNQ